MFNKTLISFFIILFLLALFIAIFSNDSLTFSATTSEFLEDTSFHYSSNAIFSWPVFGYYTISSSFGYRVSPTTGASTYHSGIDIPATEGTNIYSICSGTVTFTGFYGADGYSIFVESGNYKIIYGHVSPDYIVTVNQKVLENEKIGTVGPKYVESEENTKYFDSNGKKTNGATTGCHLHLSIYIKQNGSYVLVNPLDYL